MERAKVADGTVGVIVGEGDKVVVDKKEVKDDVAVEDGVEDNGVDDGVDDESEINIFNNIVSIIQ